MSEEQEGTKTIMLGRQELDPTEAEAYKAKIKAAKEGNISALKGNTPLGHVPRQTGTPILSKQGQASVSPMTDEGGVQPRPPGSPTVRPETVQQLKDMQVAQEKQVAAGEESLKKDVDAAAKEDLFELFDFGGKNEQERILNNRKRRKDIEERCEPMKLEDLIMKDEVQQDVPIVPGKFTARYRSATPYENLFIKRIISEEKVTSDTYLMEKYGIYQLTCSLMSINGSSLPSHLDESGLPNEDLFQKKLKVVMKKSAFLIADLGINFFWFDLRVRRLLNPDDLKNG